MKYILDIDNFVDKIMFIRIRVCCKFFDFVKQNIFLRNSPLQVNISTKIKINTLNKSICYWQGAYLYAGSSEL